MTEDYRARVPTAKRAHSIFRSPSVTTLMGICICWPFYQPWPLATLMLAAAPSPRGSDADLSIAGYVVGGFHDESLPSRQDRKSTRLNSSHLGISYAVF